ncbi:hypothetical protein GCM10018793_05500 [Streptomyces sulfonofaciens]|uniref:Uncharacterized protein n=1 Tax=Streptomyces sulfonofaciens TaxID=68272 RepID=A0A919FR32_9ACTN|nr:hypothetical protein [Streptomyces sulfonofaciens]GHH70836.1 hypothetical protein GCM10018793_05500 [Streptomyces sulfonofaciens]
MSHPGTSIKRVRTVVGVLSLVLFAQTACWLGYDVAERGVDGAWTVWTTGTPSGLSATSSLDLGLAALQLTAGWAALRRGRGAGGLLVTACAATVLFRLPVLWYLLLNSPSNPWFGMLTGASLDVVGLTCVFAVLVAAVLGTLLVRARQLENEIAEAEAAAEAAALHGGAIRPVKVTATASGAVLAVLNVVYIFRNAITAYRVGPHGLAHLLAGRGTGRAVLAVSSPWQWTCLTLLCGAGMLLAARRRPVADGFALGLSLFMVPSSFTDLWGASVAGTLFQVPAASGQNLLEVVGGLAMAALIVWEARQDRLRPLGDGIEFPSASTPLPGTGRTLLSRSPSAAPRSGTGPVPSATAPAPVPAAATAHGVRTADGGPAEG